MMKTRGVPMSSLNSIRSTGGQVVSFDGASLKNSTDYYGQQCLQMWNPKETYPTASYKGCETSPENRPCFDVSCHYMGGNLEYEIVIKYNPTDFESSPKN